MDVGILTDTRDVERELSGAKGRADAALVAAARVLDGELLAKARQRANGVEVGVRSGEYLASIKGSVFVGDGRVTGEVDSASPLARILEYGATLPPHDIVPDAREALAFMDGAQVFKRVHFPGAKLPARHVLTGALEEMHDRIETTLRKAVEGSFL